MTAEPIPHRVLLVAEDGPRAILRGLLPAIGWDPIEACSIEQACFLQQAHPSDVVVLDGGLGGADWNEALAWLRREGQTPLVLVSEVVPTIVLEALRQDVSWMPADVARGSPELLAALLAQAVRLNQQRQQASTLAIQLRECRQRIDRLLGLLWEVAPGDGPGRWYSQRHILERLDEEVARIRRHGGQLSIVLGEVRPRSGEKLDAELANRLGEWTARKVTEYKRRSDVAGQYGLGAFILVLPQATPEEVDGACRRLRTVLEDHGHEELPEIHACFGTASVPEDQANIPVLLRRAEERLDEARER